MLTSLFDLALLHNDDLVSFSDGAEAMSDNDDSLIAILNQFVESLLDLMFTFSIQSTCGFV